LDVEYIRTGVSNDLGFSAPVRAENIRGVGELAAIFSDAGLIVITAFISPMDRDREIARAACGERFHEVFVKADLQTCEARDTKGLYRRARAGEISEFTGISAPYEIPKNPQLVIDTSEASIEECVEILVRYVEKATALELRDVAPVR